ncbi:MAG: aminotransferase class I/II-fold pyridoxal phosphate-dependent enzyme, partial [Euryarchaeota archaeon]|nr:aminotransferase class I/II-fold pyridoxal phosphate-dependent enzyme [Euryarchaeota archaeon]
FQAIQGAGIAAMGGPQEAIEALRTMYAERRDALVDGLRSIGWQVEKPKATFYVWAPTPNGAPSLEVAMKMLDAGIVATPGLGFGEHGEGYIRFALTVSVDTIEDAVKRLEKVF